MLDTLSILPFSFWVTAVLLVAGAGVAVTRLNDGSGIPMLAVLGTVAFWYVGDAFYNDYPGNHVVLFQPGVLDSAWWQVALFVTVFAVGAPAFHRALNARALAGGSVVMRLFKAGIQEPRLQRQLNVLFSGCAAVYLILGVIAAVRLGSETPYFFFPFLGYKAEPWGRERIGSGFSALLTFAMYIQLLVTAVFGVVAALATNRRTFWAAIGCCLLSWPYFIFDRTRNTMLAVAIPGLLCWGFLRLRGGFVKKVIVLGVCFMAVNFWMAFVIANRSTTSIVSAIYSDDARAKVGRGARHEGLNMFEELCWITSFLEQGSYRPNWGSRYFAELVNPVPRALWAGKPMIGIDYAMARGQSGGDAGAAGVYATISTGMIGQGVVNYGRLLGPAFAALLMGVWVAVLAGLDLRAWDTGRLPLYVLGLILTFNLGRDITLITLYPFVFGLVLLKVVDRMRGGSSAGGVLPAPGRPSGSRISHHGGGVGRPERLPVGSLTAAKGMPRSQTLYRRASR